MTSPAPAKPRPLSPHLGIYKPQISTVMSILHRASGIGLALGLPVLVLWLAMLAGGEKTYEFFTTSLSSLLGQAVIFVGLVCMFAFFTFMLCCLTKKFCPSAAWLRVTLKTLALLGAIILACLARKFLFDQLPTLFDKGSYYIGIAVLVGWTWAFFYHFWNGIRHLLWDAGFFLTLRGMHGTGWFTIVISTASVLGIWLKIWGVIPS